MDSISWICVLWLINYIVKLTIINFISLIIFNDQVSQPTAINNFWMCLTIDNFYFLSFYFFKAVLSILQFTLDFLIYWNARISSVITKIKLTTFQFIDNCTFPLTFFFITCCYCCFIVIIVVIVVVYVMLSLMLRNNWKWKYLQIEGFNNRFS